jgi:catechol 1,2-dioxygenase
VKPKRREFLQWISSAAAAGALAACGDDTGGAADASTGAADADVGAPDADPLACEPTTDDALGPFFEDGAPMRVKIASDAEPGERLVVTGTIVEDDCITPVAGALLDVWQADEDGVYHDAGKQYRLRGQLMTDAAGAFRVESIRPGAYELSPGVMRPAHLHFIISKPGFATITTQLYFAGDPFLPPNDGCTTCGSDDPDRIIALAGDAVAGWSGEFPVVMRRS